MARSFLLVLSVRNLSKGLVEVKDVRSLSSGRVSYVVIDYRQPAYLG